MSSPTSDASTLATLRRALLALLMFGLAGTGAELLLAKHWEDTWQILPLALIGGALLLVAACARAPTPAALRAVRVLMILFIASAVLGGIQHYTAKVEITLERAPSLSGLALFRQALKGALPPLLAPGTMAALGLLGLLWTYGRTERT